MYPQAADAALPYVVDDAMSTVVSVWMLFFANFRIKNELDRKELHEIEPYLLILR